MRKRGRNAGRIIFGVPAVTQQDEGNAGSAQRGFGLPMFLGQPKRRGIGAQNAGVGDEFDAGLFGGLDHGAMLRRALTDFA